LAVFSLVAKWVAFSGQKSAPDDDTWGAWGGTVSEDALLACGFFTEKFDYQVVPFYQVICCMQTR
jgi:hypothetical protein